MFLRVAGLIGAVIAAAPIFISWNSRGWTAKFDSPPYSFDNIPDLTGKCRSGTIIILF
jgi:hypothetical protein